MSFYGLCSRRPSSRRPGKTVLGRAAAALALVLVVMAWAGSPAAWADGGSRCANCHGDPVRLEGLSDSWESVYVDPAQRSLQVHGGLDCTVCHGGDPNTDDPHQACIGIAHQNPAAGEVVRETCGSQGCHPDITATHLKSLHVTLNGIRSTVINLVGSEAGPARFQESCNQCHASCAECHMEEPGAHGLLFPRVENHHFSPDPNAANCWSCHGATGDTFFGEARNEEHGPSLMAQAGMVCMDCHTEPEVHGDGSEPQFIVEAAPKPECNDCHLQPENVVVIGNRATIAPQYNVQNAAHQLHPEEDVACISCHTEWYANCWNCHQGREERASYELFLAENPLTGQVYSAVHSPATGPDWGQDSPEVGGGWAIKARHSWGLPQPCETCHTDPRVYMEGLDRQARFVGGWNEAFLDADYVDQELVDLLVIDQAGLQQSAHKDIACLDCHQSFSDEVCADCHTREVEDMPAGADWSRTGYIQARENLEQARELLAEPGLRDIAARQSDWQALKVRYLQAANTFHHDPETAQATMSAIAAESQGLLGPILAEKEAGELYRQRLVMGLPLVLGLLGAGIVGIIIYRPKKER